MSVTAAAGFRAAGVACGLKSSGLPDLALVVNDGPQHAAAGVFTTNRVEAAPVTWSRQVVTDGRVAAVVLNSGGANACTGPEGFADVHLTAERVAAATGTSAADVAVCSTGLIGERLPMHLLLPGVDAAAARLSADGGGGAAEAIRTTDTVAKQAVRGAGGVTVGGMAKGAAMLSPALATMLVVLTTDVSAEPGVLTEVLRAATRTTFERVDSDACLSTNDTVLLLASGGSDRTLPRARLAALVHEVCVDLADQLVADAEGASKQVRVEVVGARTEDDAQQVARSVARSTLLKCALRGGDPNWGRVLAAVGTTTAAFSPRELDVAMNGVQVCRGGSIGEPRGGVDLSGRHVTIAIDLHAGPAEGFMLTTDLTEDYVSLNADYTT